MQCTIDTRIKQWVPRIGEPATAQRPYTSAAGPSDRESQRRGRPLISRHNQGRCLSMHSEVILRCKALSNLVLGTADIICRLGRNCISDLCRPRPQQHPRSFDLRNATHLCKQRNLRPAQHGPCRRGDRDEILEYRKLERWILRWRSSAPGLCWTGVREV